MLKLLSFLPKRWTKTLIQGVSLLRSPYTLGVRVIVEDTDSRILLVRHSYLEGWYLPGGGVEGGETLDEAAQREIQEEAGINTDTKPVLLCIYLNEEAIGRDHVGLFHVLTWTKAENFLSPNTEIVEAAFFNLEELPDDLSAATSRRIDEFRRRDFAGGKW